MRGTRAPGWVEPRAKGFGVRYDGRGARFRPGPPLKKCSNMLKIRDGNALHMHHTRMQPHIQLRHRVLHELTTRVVWCDAVL